jgi:hypothetical protein
MNIFSRAFRKERYRRCGRHAEKALSAETTFYMYIISENGDATCVVVRPFSRILKTAGAFF